MLEKHLINIILYLLCIVFIAIRDEKFKNILPPLVLLSSGKTKGIDR